MSNVTVQEALKAAIEVIEQAIPDKRGEFEEQQKLYENYPNLVYKYDYLKAEADEMQQALDQCKAALSEIEKCEPVGNKQTPYSNCQFQICDLPGQCRGEGKCHHPAYPSQQPRDWVGLSDEQIGEVIDAWESNENLDFANDYARAIEAKLKQLNTKG